MRMNSSNTEEKKDDYRISLYSYGMVITHEREELKWLLRNRKNDTYTQEQH